MCKHKWVFIQIIEVIKNKRMFSYDTILHAIFYCEKCTEIKTKPIKEYEN